MNGITKFLTPDDALNCAIRNIRNLLMRYTFPLKSFL